MPHLNYQHLQYFWVVAQTGNLTAASRELRLSPSTVSAQIKLLEEQLGYPLFQRTSRGMLLTTRGRTVARFAERIFLLGEQLLDSAEQDEEVQWARVGIESHLPKLVATELLTPLLGGGRARRLLITEGLPDELTHELVEGRLDVVFTDVPVSTADRELLVRRLGECEVTWVGAPDLVEPLRAGFPGSMDGAPVLLPDRLSSLRNAIEDWFQSIDVRPRVVAEIADSALAKALAADGVGLMVVPDDVKVRACRHYDLAELGPATGVQQRFYLLADPEHAELFGELAGRP